MPLLVINNADPKAFKEMLAEHERETVLKIMKINRTIFENIYMFKEDALMKRLAFLYEIDLINLK